MEITKAVKPFIRRGANTFGYIVCIYIYIYIYICMYVYLYLSNYYSSVFNVVHDNAALVIILRLIIWMVF